MAKQAIYITLDELKAAKPCKEGFKKLMRGIEFLDAYEVRIPLKLILEVNDAADCEFVIDALDGQRHNDNSLACVEVLYKELHKAEIRVSEEAKRLHPWPKRPDGVMTNVEGIAFYKKWDAACEAQDKVWDRLMLIEMRKILKGVKR